ncbi:hypothetical protein WA538_001047 [Blastocystis sp. DL]
MVAPSQGVTLRLNTSNENKYREFKRLFANYGINLDATHREIREIVSDPLSVAIHKASQLGEYVISEDTSLDIEGEQVGINVKWMMNELPKFVGKRAVWNVYLAILLQGRVHVYRGQVVGVIVEPRGDSNFGFDPVFQPEGAEKTLAEVTCVESMAL